MADSSILNDQAAQMGGQAFNIIWGIRSQKNDDGVKLVASIPELGNVWYIW